MQIEISHWIDLLRAGVGMVPPALIAMILLGGPTAGWLLYRFVVQPRATHRRSLDPTAMWICPSCRSVNALRLVRCYRCDSTRTRGDVELIDTHPAGPTQLRPVGRGLDLGGPGHAGARPRPVAQIERAEVIWAEDTAGWGAEEEDARALPDVAALPELVEAPGGRRVMRPTGPIPVGPGRPTVTRPAIVQPRRVVAAGPTQDPDGTPAA